MDVNPACAFVVFVCPTTTAPGYFSNHTLAIREPRTPGPTMSKSRSCSRAPGGVNDAHTAEDVDAAAAALKLGKCFEVHERLRLREEVWMTFVTCARALIKACDMSFDDGGERARVTDGALYARDVKRGASQT